MAMPEPGVLVSPQVDLLERAGRYLAGGGLGLFVLPDEVNLVIAEGHGSHITDVLGRDFIDYHLGSGPALLGHAHPAVVEAVQRQLPKGSTYYFLNEPVIKLAEMMVSTRGLRCLSLRRPKRLPCNAGTTGRAKGHALFPHG